MVKSALRVVISLFFLLANTASAQSYVFGRADFATGNLPQAIAVGDFNGDGRLDLAVVNSADNTVSILLGQADGTFAAHVDYATGAEPVSIAIGDFNGDGYLDLAITNENCPDIVQPCGPGTVSILLGNGDGTFQPHRDSATGQAPVSVGIGDFNGDGNLDLAVANFRDSTVSVLIGEGNGTFQPQVVYASDQNPGSVVVADFTGDQKLDLAIVATDAISFFLGNGNGTFQSKVSSPVSCDQYSPAAGAAGDFNRDGKLDLAVSCENESGGDQLSIFLGAGDGTFSLEASYAAGGGGVISLDLNGDGILDLVAPNPQIADSVSVLLGNGDGTFQTPATYGAGLSTTAVAAGDFNGDGAVDLAVVDSDYGEFLAPGLPGAVSVLLGLGNGTFVAAENYTTAATAESITSADFRGDGNLDLAAANYTGNSVSVWLGNGNGTFQSPSQYATGNYPIWIASGDFNGDGKPDLVTLNDICPNLPCNPGSVSVLLGNGNGTFQSHIDSSTQTAMPVSLAVGDFNGDGKLDLAVTANGQVVVLLGNGDGTFQYHAVYTVAAFVGQVVAGDFNQDGKLDLAVLVLGDNGGVSILLGNGDGTFQSPVNYNFPSGTSIGIGDFNGDGALDLVAAGTSTGDPAYVLLGNGNGTFQSAVPYFTGGVNEFAGTLVVGDFNGDGKLDFAIGSVFEVSVLYGNGDGTFRYPVPYLLTHGVSSLVTGDFNQDGAPDLAGVNGIGTLGVMLSTPFRALFPTTLNFGSQGLGTSSPAQSITVSNPSGVAFTVNSIAVSGNFSQSNDCDKVSPGANCSINLTFSPTATGVRQGTLTITDTARVSPQVVPLTGTGINGPSLTFMPPSLNFGGQAVGVPSSKQNVTLINTGNASLSITSISVGGANAADFGQTSNCGKSLTVGGSCTASVLFTPSSMGTRQAALTVSDNANGSPQMMNLEGVGLAAQAVPNPTSLTFPKETLSTTSPPQQVTLSNPGNATLTITGIYTSGDFAQTNNCGTAVAGDSSCTVTVTFTPTAGGTRNGTLTMTDSATNSPQKVSLTGTGNAPSLGLDIAPGGSSSAAVMPGATATYSLAIGGAGMSGTATLSCSGAPSGVSCAVPAAESVSATTASDFTVSVTTTAPSTGALVPAGSRRLPWVWAVGLVGLVMVPGSKSRKPSLRRYVALLPWLLLLLVCSCGGSGGGGSGNSGGTPAGTYTLTVTATVSSVKESIALTLKVQ